MREGLRYRETRPKYKSLCLPCRPLKNNVASPTGTATPPPIWPRPRPGPAPRLLPGLLRLSPLHTCIEHTWPDNGVMSFTCSGGVLGPGRGLEPLHNANRTLRKWAVSCSGTPHLLPIYWTSESTCLELEEKRPPPVPCPGGSPPMPALLPRSRRGKLGPTG